MNVDDAFHGGLCILLVVTALAGLPKVVLAPAPSGENEVARASEREHRSYGKAEHAASRARFAQLPSQLTRQLPTSFANVFRAEVVRKH
jgi:hypothetical protein